jgi:hypothetical protein
MTGPLQTAPVVAAARWAGAGALADIKIDVGWSSTDPHSGRVPLRSTS